MNDPIIDEVRRVRDAHAAQFQYDLDAIYQDIKDQERKSVQTFVSFASLQAEPNQELQLSGVCGVAEAMITH